MIMSGALMASLMFLVVKLLKDVNTFTLVFYRAVIVVVISLILLLREGTNPLRNSLKIKLLLVLRAGFGAAAVCCWFFGAQVLPLPNAVTLQFTTPPFAAFFAVLMVNEQWKLLDMIGAVVCITGVAFIAHPTWLFGNGTEDDIARYNDENDDNSNVVVQALAVSMTTLGAAFAGLAYVYVRVVGDRASALVMVFYYGTVSIPVALIGSRIFEGTWNVVTTQDGSIFSISDYCLILLIGVLGYAGQWFINVGLQHETAATATLATCTQIVWTYIFELGFLHEPIDQWSLSGTALILGYMLIVAIIKMVRSEKAEKEEEEDEPPTESTELLRNPQQTE
jgi:drug/metabolite transporter (DMT)-like permease